MSKQAPGKGNFIQTLLIMSTIWLGLLMFFGNKKPQQPPDALYKSLLEADKNLLDVTIAQQINGEYGNALNEAVNKKQMSQAEADKKRFEATLLVADTQLKAGIVRGDISRIRNAYNTIHPYRRKLLKDPQWTETFTMPDAAASQKSTTLVQEALPERASGWSGESLYNRIYKELDERNKHELVYGVLPGYAIIDALVALTGRNPAISYAFACFLLALLVRAVVYPLSEKQLRFSRQMSQLAPLTNEVRAKYKDDPQQQQVKVMEIYKEYGINPLAGCFPALLQLPLFLTVYQFMLAYQFAFQHGVFLWIVPAVSARTGGWTAPNLGEQDYPLIFLYGVTMLISVLLAPISDPSQAKQQRLMSVGISVMFTVFMFFWPVPSAFVLYWTFTNLLSMVQSLRAYRRPMPPLQKVNAPGGGVFPKSPIGGKWMQMMEEFQRQAAEQQAQQGQGKSSGGASKPGSNQVISNGEVKTGTPHKHKPKKRK